MSIITPTVLEQVAGSTSPNGAALVTWANMQNGDVGAPISYPTHCDRSVQVSGLFGAGGNVALQGSLDALNYVVLNDPQGVALNIATAKIMVVSENTTWVKPAVTAGDGTTSITVTMLIRRQP